MDRALEKAAVGKRCRGEGGRRAAALGRGGDGGWRPVPGRREERRGDAAECCHGATVESIMKRTSGREASKEAE
jgi:hypothetical protein